MVGMIHIKIELEDMNETWRISQIVINKDGEPYVVRHSEDSFPSKELAERDAQRQARAFLHANFGIGNGDIIWQVFPPV
jgi:C4-dicarboxylate-specific signal transduction histidine kinase